VFSFHHTHNVTLSVIAVCIDNPDCSVTGIAAGAILLLSLERVFTAANVIGPSANVP
jgi:hypothetical protein